MNPALVICVVTKPLRMRLYVFLIDQDSETAIKHPTSSVVRRRRDQAHAGRGFASFGNLADDLLKTQGKYKQENPNNPHSTAPSIMFEAEAALTPSRDRMVTYPSEEVSDVRRHRGDRYCG